MSEQEKEKPVDGEGASASPSEEENLSSVNELERPIRLIGGRKGKGYSKPGKKRVRALGAEQRLLILDTWKRSGLSTKAFAPLVGVSTCTLKWWRQKFEQMGPGGLVDGARGGPKGSRMAELTRRSILMIKEANPAYGCERISDMLARGPALGASPGAVAHVLRQAGYQIEESATKPNPPQVRRFERARANQLWQSDLFTFILKRQNRRVYMVAFMDDHSRFVVGYGLYATSSTALVIETLRAAIVAYGPPEEILTDNGPQYVTWRGKSAFCRELEKHGIRHIVASPRRPQTLGKVERFWGTLWRECLETAVFLDLEEARRRVGLFIDGYNFHRTHQGLEGLVPADRFFGAAPEILKTLRERVAANALELARHGLVRKPFYLTGQVGGKSFSVHAAGQRVYMTAEGREKEEIDLVGPQQKDEEEKLPEPVTPSPELAPDEDDSMENLPPGVSPLDEALERLALGIGESGEKEGGRP
jgi:transposase InsO family protein